MQQRDTTGVAITHQLYISLNHLDYKNSSLQSQSRRDVAVQLGEKAFTRRITVNDFLEVISGACYDRSIRMKRWKG